MAARITKGYWIWGQFDIATTNDITALYEKIKQKLNGPKFAVHLTIAGPVIFQKEEFDIFFDSVASSFDQFLIELDGFAYKNKFFQSLFLKVIENKELKKLKETIDSHFNLREDLYFPHISLFYGDIEREKKIEIINDLEAPRKIILDKLSIVRVDEDLQSWQIIKSYCLRHPQ